jgi:hypothetical protein
MEPCQLPEGPMTEEERLAAKPEVMRMIGEHHQAIAAAEQCSTN